MRKRLGEKCLAIACHGVRSQPIPGRPRIDLELHVDLQYNMLGSWGETPLLRCEHSQHHLRNIDLSILSWTQGDSSAHDQAVSHTIRKQADFGKNR